MEWVKLKVNRLRFSSFVKTLKGEGKKNITQIGAQCMKILKTIILKNRECKGTQ